MKIGIRLHDLGKGSVTEILDRCSINGFSYAQVVFKKAFVQDGKPLVFNEENSLYVAKELKKRNIKCAMLGAYFNPVHSNKKLVEDNIKYFKEHLKYAHNLDCDYVGTETGSYNDDKWTYNPKNQTEEGYQASIKVFKDLVKTGEKYKTTVLMEPAYAHVMYSVKCLKRAYDEINSPYLKVTIDLYNLLYIGNYMDYREIFVEALSTFKDNIKIIHLKDFIIRDNTLVQTGLGKGMIDFSFIMQNVKKYCPDATLIFEGVTGRDIIQSYELIKSL